MKGGVAGRRAPPARGKPLDGRAALYGEARGREPGGFARLSRQCCCPHSGRRGVSQLLWGLLAYLQSCALSVETRRTLEASPDCGEAMMFKAE